MNIELHNVCLHNAISLHQGKNGRRSRLHLQGNSVQVRIGGSCARNIPYRDEVLIRGSLCTRQSIPGSSTQVLIRGSLCTRQFIQGRSYISPTCSTRSFSSTNASFQSIGHKPSPLASTVNDDGFKFFVVLEHRNLCGRFRPQLAALLICLWSRFLQTDGLKLRAIRYDNAKEFAKSHASSQWISHHQATATDSVAYSHTMNSSAENAIRTHHSCLFLPRLMPHIRLRIIGNSDAPRRFHYTHRLAASQINNSATF